MQFFRAGYVLSDDGCFKRDDQIHNESSIDVVVALGEFGASGFIEGAPYALESSIENLPEELYPTIRTETFFASLKLFCKRAPEMRKAFETCLKWCATEDSDPSARATVNVYGSLMCSSSSSSKIASDLLLA